MAEPVKGAAERVTHLGQQVVPSPASSSRSSSGGGVKKMTAGKPTPGNTGDPFATGTAHVPGRGRAASPSRQRPSPRAAAGASSESLAAHTGVPLSAVHVGDTAQARKKALPDAPPSFSVLEHHHAPPVLCGASASAGITGAGSLGLANEAIGNRSSVDSVVFGRDIDRSDARADPRHATHFHGAAGSASGSPAAHAALAASQGHLVERVERLYVEDIPHSRFSAVGLRRGVDAAAQRGAAGAATLHTDAQYFRQVEGVGARGGAAAAIDANAAGMDTRLTSASAAAARDICARSTASATVDDHAPLQRSYGAATAGQRTVALAAKGAVASGDVDLRPDLAAAGGAGVAYGGAGARSGPPAHPSSLRPAHAILEAGEASAPYEVAAEWAGLGGGAARASPGRPGQRKWVVGGDYVGVRPVGEISDLIYDTEACQPSAGNIYGIGA